MLSAILWSQSSEHSHMLRDAWGCWHPAAAAAAAAAAADQISCSS